jgi:hypothetical protein
MTPKSRGSRRVGEAFHAAARKRGHLVLEEVPLPNIIDLATLVDHFTAEEIRFVAQQRFDFVLYSPDKRPLLALEFDGPCHADAAKRRADIRKHRACWVANLTIRRFRVDDVQSHDKRALVDWAADRYFAWSERDPERDFFFEFEDPRLWFDLLCPFPGCYQKAAHLWQEYGILSNLLESDVYDRAVSVSRSSISLELEYAGSFSGPDGDFSRWFTLRRELRKRSFLPNEPSNILIATFERSASYDWALPAFPGPGSISPKPVHTAIGIPESILESIFVPHNTPGTTAEELTQGFMEYLVLSDAIKWARANLKRRRINADS